MERNTRVKTNQAKLATLTGVLSNTAASTYASILEGTGWRAEAVTVINGIGLVEVRDQTIRHHPLIATLRTYEDVRAFTDAHPGHGLIGRVPTTRDHGMRPTRVPFHAGAVLSGTVTTLADTGMHEE
jgi:hypothetical protein